MGEQRRGMGATGVVAIWEDGIADVFSCDGG